MKNVGNSSRGLSHGVPKIFTAPMYRAHCAVIFAIAQHSCCKWVYMLVTGLKRQRQMIQYVYVNTLIVTYMLSKSWSIPD